MAREKGTFNVSANYEPLKAAPFDARSLVKTKADLTNIATWTINNDIWIYDGMLVTVAQDANPKFNGVYRLVDAENFNFDGSWMKLANDADLAEIEASKSYTVNSEQDLPEIGDENATYYIRNTKSIKKWSAEEHIYVSYGGSSINIQIIDGGNAHG